MNWVDIFKYLDHPDFVIPDKEGFELLITAWRSSLTLHANKTPFVNFPIETLWGRWENPAAQFSFLFYALQFPTDSFNFTECKVRKVVTAEIVSQNRNLQALLGSTWNCIELIETFVGLAETEQANEVKNLLVRGAEQAPEIVCLGLAQIKVCLMPFR